MRSMYHIRDLYTPSKSSIEVLQNEFYIGLEGSDLVITESVF